MSLPLHVVQNFVGDKLTLLPLNVVRAVRAVRTKESLEMHPFEGEDWDRIFYENTPFSLDVARRASEPHHLLFPTVHCSLEDLRKVHPSLLFVANISNRGEQILRHRLVPNWTILRLGGVPHTKNMDTSSQVKAMEIEGYVLPHVTTVVQGLLFLRLLRRNRAGRSEWAWPDYSLHLRCQDDVVVRLDKAHDRLEVRFGMGEYPYPFLVAAGECPREEEQEK